MQNQIHIGSANRCNIMRLLVDAIPSTQFDILDDNIPDIVTDEMIAKDIHPKQKLNIDMMWGRPFFITESEKIIDVRKFMENLGYNAEKIIREINVEVRKLTGSQLM